MNKESPELAESTLNDQNISTVTQKHSITLTDEQLAIFLKLGGDASALIALRSTMNPSCAILQLEPYQAFFNSYMHYVLDNHPDPFSRRDLRRVITAILRRAETELPQTLRKHLMGMCMFLDWHRHDIADCLKSGYFWKYAD